MGINRDKVLNKAQKQVRKRNWKKALRYYRELIDDDPGDMRSLLKCGDLYARLDRNEEAIEAYKTVADTYAQDERYQKAIAVYKQARRMDEDDVAISHAIGECHYRLGRLKDAIRTFHDVQRLYEERGDHDNQRSILEHMVRIDPDDVGLRIQLAERYTKDGLRNEALEAFHWCSDILRNEGRLDELAQVLERIIYLSPNGHDHRKELVRIYLDRGDDEKALKHLQICFRELTNDVETLELLAQTFERLDRDEKAVMVLEELATLYKKAGRQADLDNLHRRILRLDPDNEMARQATGADEGPDSGMLAGRHETGPVSRQTPPPGTSTEEIEFLDDDIEFLDDDLVTETEPAPSGARPQASVPSPPSDLPSTPPETRDDVEPLDLSDDVELIDDEDDAILLDDEVDAELLDDEVDAELIDDEDDAELLDDEVDVEPVDTSAGIEEIDQIEAVDEIEAVEPVDEEAMVREMLSECDSFLQVGLYDKAANVIEQALNDYPESIHAHQRLLELHRATGNTEQQVEALLGLAELASFIPSTAKEFLSEARQLAADPQRIDAFSQQLGIEPDTQDLEAEPEQPDPVPHGEQPPTGDIEVDDAPQPLDDDDPFADALEGLDAAIDSYGKTIDDDVPVDEAAISDIGDADIELDELEPLTEDTDIASDDDLAFDDADDIVEMDLSSDASGFDDSELESLDAATDSDADQQGDGEVNTIFSDVEADDLFDDLFGGASAENAIEIGGDDPEGDMEEIDFLLQQGLTEEAEEALQKFESKNPDHPGIDRRRNQLRQLRSGVDVDENPFGSRSLSKKFHPEPLTEDPGPGADSQPIELDSVVNSNLELGVSYREMGLVEEAIQEFEQAAEDPEAAASAYYNIGLCEMDLGRQQAALNTFHELLEMDEVNPDLRSAVREKLDELEAQAS